MASRAPHGGADLRATGTPAYAANRGRVVLAKNLFDGNAGSIRSTARPVHHVFAILREIKVEPGTVVERGQLIGLAGATGRV